MVGLETLWSTPHWRALPDVRMTRKGGLTMQQEMAALLRRLAPPRVAALRLEGAGHMGLRSGPLEKVGVTVAGGGCLMGEAGALKGVSHQVGPSN